MSNPAAPYSIVIIGGAYSGASMVVHLLQHFGTQIRSGRVRVSVVERTLEPGTGLAWSGTMASDWQLCNLPVAALSLSDAFRPTFERWLVDTYPGRFGADSCLAAAYPPRRLFGEYVKTMLEGLIAEPNVCLHTDAEAVSVEPWSPQASHVGQEPPHRYRVKLQRAKARSDEEKEFAADADCVVLCVGAPSTGSGSKFPQLSGCAGYIESPWPAFGLAEAAEGATRIAILGTGLTAIDVVKHLHASLPETPVLMTSRQGRFNVVARDLRRTRVAEQAPYECRILTRKTLSSLPARCSLEQCVQLVQQEIEACMGETAVDWDEVLQAPQGGVAEWRRQVAAHRAGLRLPWQLAMIEIDKVFPQLWKRLSDADRARWFASEMRTMYQNYSNPLPIESAKEVLSLIDRGRVVVRSKLKAVQPHERGGFRLLYPDRHDPEIEVSHCINCTGVGFDVSQDRRPLMRQLLRDGLLHPHPFGGVLLDSESLRVADHEGEASARHQAEDAAGRRMYVVGHCARGVRYLTSGLGFIQSMVNDVVEDLARELTA